VEYLVGNGLPVAALQIVNNDDFVALLLQKVACMGTDVASSAGNKNGWQAPLSLAVEMLGRMALLELRSVTKRYESEGTAVLALDDLSLSVEAGQFLALVGRSGCGKSTLLNLCGAMDFPTAGTVLLDGQDTKALDDTGLTRLRREKVGFVFQSFQLIHTLTALENVELPLLLAKREDVRRTALERLDWVELETLGHRFPHQLSGGQQQRVAIARALAGSPRLLLADEPTGNLDTTTGELVLSLLRRIARELKVAILMATHSMESIALVDEIVKLRDGRIVGIEMAEATGVR
jgi:putative ABC transport system ATP-binding protein